MSNEVEPQTTASPTDAFLRPESMVTPGALGALTMLITNALANNFMFVDHKVMAILLSFLFGTIAIIKSSSLLQKAIFYVINSLIIFSVATGSNTIGSAVSGERPAALRGGMLLRSAYALSPSMRHEHKLTEFSRIQFFQPWFDSPQEGSETQPPLAQPSETEGGWSVVVGSFKTQSEAQKAAADINDRLPGRYSTRVSKTLSGETWAVTIGGLDLNLSAAAAIQKQAAADGLADVALLRSNIYEQAPPATIKVLATCPDSECSKWKAILPDLIQIVGIQVAPIDQKVPPQPRFVHLSRSAQGQDAFVNVHLQESPSHVGFSIPTADAPPSIRNSHIAYNKRVEQTEFVLKSGGVQTVTIHVRPEFFNFLRPNEPRFVITGFEP